MTYFYYFSYGSNLLKQRIRVQNKGAEFVCTGILHAFKLDFVAFSKRWQGALATVLQNPNHEVWGCVWRVPMEYSGELDKQETGYNRLTVPVKTSNGIIDCRTYQFADVHAKKEKPSPHYKTVILAGAIENDLPADYVKKLYEVEDNGYCGKVDVDLDVIRHLNEHAK